MNKILVPCDFSEMSDTAINYAVELTKYFSGSLVLLNITQIPVITPEFGITAYAYPDVVHDSEKSLNTIAETIKRNNPLIVDVECHTEMGNASDSVLEYTQKHNIDLIVMGISGHGSGFMKAFFGSTAVSVSKKTNVPLIIIPPNYAYKKIQNIAYACDYETCIKENTALIQVKYLNTLLGSMLHVLHVIPENHELNSNESKVDIFIEEKLGSSHHKTFIIADDNVSNGLLMYVKNHDIDMIIVEPKKHNIWHNIFSQSVTNEVAFYSPVPVLTIHG